MSLLEWGERFSVGIPAVDSEHKQLVQIINKLHEAMVAGQGGEAVGEILDDLIDYTNFHFATEERLMREYAYPKYAEHKAAHEALTQQVIELRDMHRKGDLVLSVEVMIFLNNWLTEHVLDMDMKYGPYLRGLGAATRTDIGGACCSGVA